MSRLTSFGFVRSAFTIALSASVLSVAWMPQCVADERCTPTLTLKSARTSEVQDLQRTWTALVTADASRCATTSGTFEIQFTRLKEIAPDLRFTEQFRWRAGEGEVSLDFWWDEWPQDFQVASIAACPCRD
jgi:hypothetical protein